MNRLLCTLEGREVIQEAHGKVHFIADADIDADGANGQYGKPCAYRPSNKGTEHLANAGYPKHPEWYREILVCGDDGNPIVFPGSRYFSRTAFQWPGRTLEFAYVDSETVPYIVVSPLIRQKAKGIVLGCRAKATYKGKSVDAVVADIGPRMKVGELSIAAARAIGIPSNPRTGGTDENVVTYELWPGVAATVNGETYLLQAAGSGSH